MDTPRYRTRPVPHEGYPPGIPFIVGNEAAERFSFYGMKVLLTAFFLDALYYTEVRATGAVHLFVVAVYLTPMLGAYVADRFWGKYRTILVLSGVYCVGHLILALMDLLDSKALESGFQLGEAQAQRLATVGGAAITAMVETVIPRARLDGWFMVSGLAFIALGAGGIKPCVSAHVGDQFAKGEEKKLEKIFGLFYFTINFGAGFSQIIMPKVRDHYGNGWAFGIPGILMGIATVVFWLGRNRFVHVPPSGPNPNSFWKVVFYALGNQAKKPAGGSWLDAARDRFDDVVVTGVRAVIGVLGVFVFICVFWMLQDQMSTTWTIQARSMNLQIVAPSESSGGWTIAADQVQSLNAFLVMILIPIMTYGIYPMLGRLGFEMTALRRMAGGMLCSFVSFIGAGTIQLLIDRGESISVLWQIPGYVVITLAEVMVSITGLEFAYTQAPKSMKSTLMGFWLLTIAIGNFLIEPFLRLSNWMAEKLEKMGIGGLKVVEDKVTAANFFMFAALMLLAALAFTWTASRYKPVNFMEPADDETP